MDGVGLSLVVFLPIVAASLSGGLSCEFPPRRQGCWNLLQQSFKFLRGDRATFALMATAALFRSLGFADFRHGEDDALVGCPLAGCPQVCQISFYCIGSSLTGTDRSTSLKCCS